MKNNQPVHILGLCGSIRKDSLNLKLLKAAGQLLPEHVSFKILDLADIPHYNQEVENNLPATVLNLVEEAKKADAVIISTPEYNYSIPGPLKDALDWVSRQFVNTPLNGKPAAILGASPGMHGTVRGQAQLRQILLALNTRTITRPEVYVGQADTKFNEQDQLIDETTKKFVQQLMDNLMKEIETQ